jgi:hypothetical protein
MEQFDTIARIAVLENEVKNIAKTVNDIQTEQKEMHSFLVDRISKLHDRINEFERWKWMIMGGACVIGFLISQVIRFIPS